MKVGKEIRALKKINSNIISSVSSTLRSRQYGFFKAVFLGGILLNILLLPINVSLNLTQAAVVGSDSDPAHALQMQSLIQAVQSGADTDPVHAAQVAAYLDTQPAATQTQAAAQTAQAPDPAPAQPPSQPFATPVLNLDAPALAAASTDPDPGHALQMESLIKAVQSGADTDPVHAAQVAAYLGTQTATAQTQTSPVQAALAQTTQPAQTPQAVPATQIVSSNNSGDPLSGLQLYVNQNSEAASQAQSWSASSPGDASKMSYLAAQPTAAWFGNWDVDVQGDVSKVVSAAQKAGQAPVLVAYNIPGRDCGGYSQGGANSASDYTNWIGAFARGIGQAPAVVILEPDALAGISCLSAGDQQARTDMLASAVSILKSNANTRVYLDAGHAGWVDAPTIAARLQKAGIQNADGFALNVSNFDATGAEADYGAQISSQLSGLIGEGKHFVIDTSRNGNGGNGQWCNPSGQATGATPTANTGNSMIDAYLWVKTPGESDGNCNGGPAAGVWWPEYALSLVK